MTPVFSIALLTAIVISASLAGSIFYNLRRQDKMGKV